MILKEYLHYYVTVMDQAIQISVNFSPEFIDISSYFETTSETSQTPQLKMAYTDKLSGLAFIPEEKRLTYAGERISSHLIRIFSIFLAGAYSERYHEIHGASFRYMDQSDLGLLLLGENGAGKSTIVDYLEAENLGTIMDDDLCYTDGKTMYVTGKMGSTTIEDKEKKTKKLKYHPKGIKELPLDLVLLLNRKKESGYYKRLTETNMLKREWTVIDSMPKDMLEPYLERPPIPIDAPIIEVGTGGVIEKTAETVQNLIYGANR